MKILDLFLISIRKNLECLLAGQISGEEFVRRYNDLMADEIPDELDRSGAIYRLLDDYHTEFNLYVENPEWRDEHPDDYYGLDQLQDKAKTLLDRLLDAEVNR